MKFVEPVFATKSISNDRKGSFKQADIVRAIKAAQKANLPVTGIEVDKQAGALRVFTAKIDAAEARDSYTAWKVRRNAYAS
jgi:hypothetical protein